MIWIPPGLSASWGSKVRAEQLVIGGDPAGRRLSLGLGLGDHERDRGAFLPEGIANRRQERLLAAVPVQPVVTGDLRGGEDAHDARHAGASAVSSASRRAWWCGLRRTWTASRPSMARSST